MGVRVKYDVSPRVGEGELGRRSPSDGLAWNGEGDKPEDLNDKSLARGHMTPLVLGHGASSYITFISFEFLSSDCIDDTTVPPFHLISS